MHKSLLAAAALIAGLAVPLTTAGPAQARDGCGPGLHRGHYGWCRPNLGPRPFAYRPYGYRPAFYHPYGWYGPRSHRWGWRRW